jgi:hypothetical protein
MKGKRSIIWYVIHVFTRSFEYKFNLHNSRIKLLPSNNTLLFQSTLYSLNQQFYGVIIRRLKEPEMNFI